MKITEIAAAIKPFVLKWIGDATGGGTGGGGDMYKAEYDPDHDSSVELADHAVSADHAVDADYAATAGDADTVDGSHAAAFELVANKGQASGYAPLDSGSRVPNANLPTDIVRGPGSATDGHVAVFNGSTGKAIADGGVALLSPMTEADDIIVGGVGGVAERLGKGADGSVLGVDPATHHLGYLSGSTTVTVEEVDGSPSVAASTIQLPNGTVSDQGGGVARYTPPTPTVTVREVDTSPSVAANTIEFPNGTLTDEGSGVVRYTPSGAGGDVTGPASSVAGHVATFADTTGKVIQDGGAPGVEVKEQDGAPDVTGVTQIRVPNGTLTSNGGGAVSLSYAAADHTHPPEALPPHSIDDHQDVQETHDPKVQLDIFAWTEVDETPCYGLRSATELGLEQLANKGQADGYCELDSGGLVPAERLPATGVIAHHTTHEHLGDDAIKLDDLETPDDNTDLNATTTHHGLLPRLGGGSTNFLREDGTWAPPPAGSGSGNADPNLAIMNCLGWA